MDYRRLSLGLLASLVFVLVLILTKTYSVIAVFIGREVSFVTAAVMIFLLLIFFNRKSLQRIPYFPATYLIVGPLLISFVHSDFDFRTLILQFFYFMIIIVGYTLKDFFSMKTLNRIFIFSFYMTFMFGILSVVNPAFFKVYAEKVDSLNFYYGRAYGFYLQPNAFSMGLIINYILIIATWRNSLFNKLAFLLLLLGVGLSASRLGILFSVSLLIFFVFFKIEKYKSIRRTALIGSVFLLGVLIFNVDSISKKIEITEIESRIKSLNIFENNYRNDGSLNARLDMQEYYIKAIGQSPYIGYGLGSQSRAFQTGTLINSAHNTFLEILYQGGIAYFVFFLYFFLFFVFKILKRSNFELPFVSFILVLIGYSFFSTTLFSERITYLAIGLLYRINEDNYIYFKFSRRRS